MLNCQSLFSNHLFLQITKICQIFLRRINRLLNGLIETFIHCPIQIFMNLIGKTRIVVLGSMMMLIVKMVWWTSSTYTVLTLSHNKTWNMNTRNWFTIWLQIAVSTTHIYWKQHLLSLLLASCLFQLLLLLDFNLIFKWKQIWIKIRLFLL